MGLRSMSRGIALGLGFALIAGAASPAKANIEVWSYSIAEMNGIAGAFPLPEPPAQFLSGALWFKKDQPVIVMGDSTGKTAKEGAVAMMFGFAILSAMNHDPKAPTGLKCSGDGDDLSDAVRVDSAPSGMEDVDAAALCIAAKRPDDVWRSSRLIADGDQYYAISEYREANNAISFVYIDLTDWAKKASASIP